MASTASVLIDKSERVTKKPKTTSTLFAGVVAHFVGPQSNIQFSMQRSNFQQHGGEVSSSDVAATYVICHEQSAMPSTQFNVPIVSSQWITACLMQKSLLPIDQFVMSSSASKPIKPVAPQSTPIAASAASVNSEPVVDADLIAFAPPSSAFTPISSAQNYSLFQQSTMYRFVSTGYQATSKFACFDLDSTLIVTESGNAFPKNETDWKLYHNSVPGKLQELVSNGFSIVIFTNQKGISTGKQTIKSFCSKLDSIQQAIAVPIQAFISTTDDMYRKPCTQMFHVLDLISQVDRSQSFYVGDAAGRPAGFALHAPKKKDFSCSDRQFALNIHLSFFTPEQYFLGQSVAPFELGFDPRSFVVSAEKLPSSDISVMSGPVEMVVFVGFPGSGKSSYFYHHFEPQGYAHINRDTLKTPAKCLSAARDALIKGQSCVIDNTNPSREARSPFIALAKELGVPVRCVYFDVSRHAAEHMNDYRALMGISEAVPTMAYNMFVSKFEAPSKSEGFVSVINYQFQPHFENDRQRRLFMHFL